MLKVYTFFILLSFFFFSFSLKADIYINEIASKGTDFSDASGAYEDWFELYNSGSSEINLNGFYLTDDIEEMDKYLIDGNVIVPAHGFVTFFADKDSEEGILHTNFKFKGSGEEVALVEKEGDEFEIIDYVVFGDIPFKYSYGRITDGSENFVNFGEITPNESNDGALLYLSPPTVSLESGIYQENQTVTISHSDVDVVIKYTLDGSIPDIFSLTYIAPIIISQNITIRTLAIKTGYSPSPVVNNSYFIGDAPNVNILSLTTDPDNFFDDEIGIYVVGTNGTLGYCDTIIIANYNQPWERPVNVKMILNDGSLAFDVNAGIKIGGNCSRQYPMKSLNLYLKAKTYGDKSIEYPLFDVREVHEYKRIKIRNSGQDYLRIGFRDALNHTLLFNTVDIDLQASQTVLVYLNSEFFGVYNIRENYAGEYFERIYDVKEKDLDIIKNPKMPWEDIKEGTVDEYDELFDFVTNNDFTNSTNYNYFKSQVDINSFINFWIIGAYLANYDWPSNNLTVWRDRENNGKWRYLIQDTDASTYCGLITGANSEYPSLPLITTPGEVSWPNNEKTTLFLRKLLERPEFKNEFIQRTCSIIELIYNSERVNPKIDSFRNIFAENVDLQFDKWGDSDPDPWGGGTWAWNYWVDKYEQFFQERPNIMRTQLDTVFGLSGTFLLSFNYPDTTKGDIFINSNEMRIPYNYEGEYFKNIPVKLKAVAKQGYIFVRWDETGDTSSEISFVANEDFTLTPIFDIYVGISERSLVENLKIFPNPATKNITIAGTPLFEPVEVRIFSVTGEVTFEKRFKNPVNEDISINTNELSQGIYFVELIAKNGLRKKGKFAVLRNN